MSDAKPDRDADQRLLDTIVNFVVDHPEPGVRPFCDGVANWGRDWVGVAPRHLPAADTLGEALALTAPRTRGLTEAFHRERASRKWEQSYSKVDGLVGDDMLAGYGFAEVIGKWGPFLSERVRAGIGVWGPRIDYPPHRHQAEEVYVVLAGHAEFRLEGHPPRLARAGEAVLVTPLLTHGFRTHDDPLAVLYIWQAGDLRETSTFD